MNDSDALALADVDTLAFCGETVLGGWFLHRDTREIALVPPSEVAEQRARATAAKLSLPHQGFVLGRPRLRRSIEAVRGGGVVSLVAGPGCGKTAFIVDVLRSSAGRTVYFSLDEGDRDPVRFLTYLRAGLEMEGLRLTETQQAGWPEVDSGGGSVMDMTADLMEVISGGVGVDRAGLGDSALHGGFPQADAGQPRVVQPTILAIEDFHLVDASPRVVDAVGLIARGLPPGWTMLLSSRRPLPFDLEAVGLGGRLVRLTARDLRLTPGEITAWAAKNWSMALEPAEARSLWRLSEGWPAALVLLGQQLVMRGRASHGDLLGLMSRGRDLRAYLEQHILTGLDPLTAEVMLVGALLPRLIFPRDVEYLPGLPGDAEAALEQLVARGFLVTRSGRRSYTVHPLVKAYAERQAWGSDEGAGAISRAAAHLESIGEYHRAASLYLRAGRFDDAARPLRALALSSLNAVADFAHEGWADLLPDGDDVNTGAWLLVAKARMLQQQAGFSPAAALYERAARQLSAAGDEEGLLPVLLGLVYCLFSLGRWDESLAVVKRCRTLARHPGEKVEVLVVEGNILVSLCRWDEAVEDWERALALAPPEGKQVLTQRILILRSRLFSILGHYRLTRQWAERAAAGGAHGTTAHAIGLNALAFACGLVGEYERSERLADECLELIRSRGCVFLTIPTLLHQAVAAQGRWDYHRAVGLIREAQAVAAATDDGEGIFRSEEMFGDLSRRNRNAKRALEHHRKALAVADEHRLAASERVSALASIGMDLAVLGRAEEALAALEETVRLSRRWSLKASLAGSLFYLGWLHAVSGREQDGARCLTESMRIAEEHGHLHFFSQEAKVAVPVLALCDRVAAGSFIRKEVLPLLPVRLAVYFEELARGRTYPTDVPLGLPAGRGLGRTLPMPLAGDQVDPATMEGIEALTDRERDVLKMIALGMPNKQIAAKMFISEKTVKTHANKVFRKLGVANRLQATLAFQSYQRARRAGGAARPKR